MALLRSNACLQPLSIQSCANCALADMCLPLGLSEPEMTRLDGIIKKARLFKREDVIFSQGQPFQSIFAVRAGAVKTFGINASGEEHITGFSFPGELLGLSGLHNQEYHNTAVALETTSLCEIPFEKVDKLSAVMSELRHQIMSHLSQEIADDQCMMLTLAHASAEERIMSFLVGLSRRFGRLGFSSTRFRLPMTRADIGNHLGIAVETVSRTLTKLQMRGRITVDGKEVALIEQ